MRFHARRGHSACVRTRPSIDGGCANRSKRMLSQSPSKNLSRSGGVAARNASLMLGQNFVPPLGEAWSAAILYRSSEAAQLLQIAAKNNWAFSLASYVELRTILRGEVAARNLTSTAPRSKGKLQHAAISRRQDSVSGRSDQGRSPRFRMNHNRSRRVAACK